MTVDPSTGNGAASPKPDTGGKAPLLLLASSLFAMRLAAVVTAVALPLLVISRYGVGLETGLTVALELLPNVLFGPIAGEIIDRYDARKIAVLCALAGAPIVAAFPLTQDLWQVQVLSLVSGATYAAGVPARLALRSQVIPKGSELSGNSVLVAAQRIPTLVGPALAALVLHFGYVALFVSNAAVGVCAAALLAIMPVRPRVTPDEESGSAVTSRNLLVRLFRHSVPELGRVIGRNPGLLGLTITACTYMFASYGMGKFFMAAFSAESIGQGNFFGYLVAAMGLGAVAGSAVAPLSRRMGQGIVFVSVGLIETVAWLSFALHHNRIGALAAAVVIGLCESIGAVVFYSEVQTRLPDRMVGRYFSIYIAFSDGLVVLGSMAIGVVAGASVGAGALLIGASISVPLLILCPLFLSKRFWRAADRVAVEDPV